MAGVVHIPWYATVFRGDQFEEALGQIAPLALRYGASDYRVYRSRDDSYKFLHMSTFEEKADFERFWYGPDFNAWRAEYSSFYQVPIVYVWNDLVLSGGMPEAHVAAHGSPAESDTV